MKRIVVSFFYSVFLFQILAGVGRLPIGMGQTSVLWGLDDAGKLFVQRSDCLEQGWKYIKSPKKIQTIAAGKHLSVWVILADNTVLLRTGISAHTIAGTSWVAVNDVKLKHIAVGTNTCVWGITCDGTLVFREKVTDEHPQGLSWHTFGIDKFKKITLSPRNQLWALTEDGRLLFKKNGSKFLKRRGDWKVIDQPQPLTTIEVGGTAIWALDKTNTVWIRTGISSYLPEGNAWKQLGKKKIRSLSIGPDDAVWGINEKGMLVERVGITPTHKSGYAWKKVSGKLFKKIETAVFEGEDKGGRSYTTSCGSEGAFHSSWCLKKRGAGWVTFKARSPSALYLYVSSEPDAKHSYKIKIESKKSQNWILYWVRLHHGSLSWGRYENSGKVLLGKIKNRDLFDRAKYIGFGGTSSHIHEYKDIKTDGMGKSTQKVVIPRGFSQIPGKAQRIAVGLHDDRYLALSLGFDHKLYEYDESIQTWKMMTDTTQDGVVMKFKDMSVSSDAHIVALDMQGCAMQYDRQKNVWSLIEPESALRFDRITIGNKMCTWALDKDSKNVYQLTPHGWQERATGGGMSIDAGADGTVVAINTSFDAYSYDYNVQDWQDFDNRVTLGRIAVGSKEHMWGTHATPDGFHVWRYDHNEWKRAKSARGLGAYGLKQVSVNDRGDVLALDLEGNVYRYRSF